jgi:hypothetical protein
VSSETLIYLQLVMIFLALMLVVDALYDVAVAIRGEERRRGRDRRSA